MSEPEVDRPSPPNPREAQERRLNERMAQIRHKVLVLSGKGGVGKSTVAVNLAVSLAEAGRRVGLLDADLHGPTVPKLLGLDSTPAQSDGETILPVEHPSGLRVMSIGLLGQDPDEAVIWRGPLKMNALRQFLTDVQWGALDFLVVDLPPGTGDEPLSICQLLPGATGAVVVTTPQDVAVANVRKCVTFCRRLRLPVLGVIENMSGFVCPHCGRRADVFGEGGGRRMAEDMGVPFLGRVPLDATVTAASDAGHPFVHATPDGAAAEAFRDAIRTILAL